MPPIADRSNPRAAFLGAVLAPVGATALAYALWAISDRLLWIGPLDRAAFGWVVVVPTWLAAPIAGGFAARHLGARAALAAAAAVTLILAAVSGLLFWRAIAVPSCDYGSLLAPEALIVPTATVGLSLGGGVALAGGLARLGFRNGSWRIGLVGGAGASVVAFTVTVALAIVAFGDQGCNRPPGL